MTAALMAGVAVWCLVPGPPTRRARAVLSTPHASRRPDPVQVASLLVPVAAVVVLGLPLGAVVGLALVPVVRRSMARLESSSGRRRAALVEAALPSALDLMVAALQVGRPPVTAFALAAEATSEPLGSDLAAVASRLAVAADPDAVWRSLLDDPALAPVGRAFRRAGVSGMPVAHVVSGVADELRRDRRARLREQSRKVAVQTAAPLGACFLPAFFLVGVVPTVLATFRTLGW